MSAAAIATAGAANKEESAVETEKEISPTAPVHFVITSFGPFRGVAVNPTQTLLERFRARECWPTVLVETSAEAARAAVEDIYNTHRPLLKDRTVVVLHLGVNYKGRMFQIERCAFNDATFRVPGGCPQFCVSLLHTAGSQDRKLFRSKGAPASKRMHYKQRRV